MTRRTLEDEGVAGDSRPPVPYLALLALLGHCDIPPRYTPVEFGLGTLHIESDKDCA
jgi:hypothetical protein